MKTKFTPPEKPQKLDKSPYHPYRWFSGGNSHIGRARDDQAHADRRFFRQHRTMMEQESA